MGRVKWSDLQPMKKGEYKKWKTKNNKSLSSATYKTHKSQGAASGKLIEKAIQIKEVLSVDKTEAEAKVHEYLKKSKIPFEFQKIFYIGIKFIVIDFLIANKHVLEIDGGQHFKDNKLSEDINRDKFFKKRGYTVTRVSNAYIKGLDSRQFFNFIERIRNQSTVKLATYKVTDKLTFGKYSGKTIMEIYILDKSYLVWMYRTNICKYEDSLMKSLKLITL